MNHYPDKKLLGSVKKIREERVVNTITGERHHPERRSSMTSVYDERGQELETVFYNEFGEPSTQNYREYDQDGHLIKQKTFNLKDKLNAEMIYQDNRLIEMIEYNPDETVRFRSRYLYDLVDRLIYSVRLSPDGIISDREEITYHKNGSRTEETVFAVRLRDTLFDTFVMTANGFQIRLSVLGPHRQRVAYNAENNPTAVLFYGKDNLLLIKYEILYDSHGHLGEVNQYLISPSSQHPEIQFPPFLADAYMTVAAVYFYAREGDLNQSLKSFSEGTLETRTRYYFNYAGLPVKESKFFLGISAPLETEFTYDEHNHLLSKIQTDFDGTISRKENLT